MNTVLVCSKFQGCLAEVDRPATGDELFHYLTKHGPIDPPTVQKIFTQLVGAVSYVHGKSCVHRDLKLENILLDNHDNVKLCDFGFTREYEGNSSYLQTWCGTVCYSAPEMLKGEKYAGEKVDVWSLGVILYALLCGELPFDEDEENATKVLILKEEPKYPETMPQGAKDLISALLSKRPILRPSLADILTNPWLADHAPQQQAILKLQQPQPFTSRLELDTLERLHGAGTRIDDIKEHVLSQRCDALTGWWALLLEKEERRENRRQRRKKEREAEGRASRRVSTASNFKLDGIIKGREEEKPKQTNGTDSTQPRGRETDRRNGSGEIKFTFIDREIISNLFLSQPYLPISSRHPLRSRGQTPTVHHERHQDPHYGLLARSGERRSIQRRTANAAVALCIWSSPIQHYWYQIQ